MIHQRFYTNVVIRVLLMAFTCLILAYTVFQQKDIYIALNGLLLLVIQVCFLITYVNRINRDIAHFFSAISNDDTTVLYKRNAPGRSFKKLYDLFDEINLKIKYLKLENSKRSLYLNHLVDHAGIGIITYARDGRIDIFNPAAKKLLNLSFSGLIQHICDVEKTLGVSLRTITSGEQHLLKTSPGNEPLPLSIRASDFNFMGETIRLITFQGIQSELEDNELASWQKLIRTLTHEIMNSIGPISSTIETIRSLFEKMPLKSGNESVVLPRETLLDTIHGLGIIEERAQGLLDFVQSFRTLTASPTVHFTSLKIKELLIGINDFFSSEIERNHIHLSVIVDPESLSVVADKQLLEQILINLVTNSIQSLSITYEKRIKLSAFSDYSGKIRIQVTDNGSGICDEIKDKVFIPFFTTKENGSGIGLSLSRQIMRLHKGNISFTSVPHVETTFTLVLNPTI